MTMVEQITSDSLAVATRHLIISVKYYALSKTV